MAVSHPGELTKALQRLGARSDRNLFWACRDELNFGDWVGPLLFDELSGGEAIYCRPSKLIRGTVHLTVGSVLSRIQSPDRVIVWGSGIAFADADFARPLRVHAVRGPRTRNRMLDLGYDCPEVYGDPALLLPVLFPIADQKKHELGIVPHFVDAQRVPDALMSIPGAKVIDVLEPPLEVARQIAACRRVVSSSLHGIIVAHAYGVPASRLILSDAIKGDGVKYDDYIEAFGGAHSLQTLDPTQMSDGELIAAAVAETPVPDPRDLQRGLIESCPFATPARRADALARL